MNGRQRLLKSSLAGEITKVEIIELLVLEREKSKSYGERVEELEEELYNLGDSAYQTQMDFLDVNRQRNVCANQNKRYREAIEETLQAMGVVDRQKYGKTLERALEESE